LLAVLHAQIGVQLLLLLQSALSGMPCIAAIDQAFLVVQLPLLLI
jgi:hypothetical protein